MDQRLVEYVAAAPQNRICQPYDNKRMIKRALKGIIPSKVMRAASKVSPKPLYLRALKEHLALVDSTVIEQHELLSWLDHGHLKKFAALVSNDQARKLNDATLWQLLSLVSWNYQS